jgi:hypothetical protein
MTKEGNMIRALFLIVSDTYPIRIPPVKVAISNKVAIEEAHSLIP